MKFNAMELCIHLIVKLLVCKISMEFNVMGFYPSSEHWLIGIKKILNGENMLDHVHESPSLMQWAKLQLYR